MKNHKQVREERQPIHGDFRDNLRQTGRTWAALLSNHLQFNVPDLPPHVVAAMMVSFKLERAVRPFQKEDNEDWCDARNYLDVGEETANNFLHEGEVRPMPPAVVKGCRGCGDMAVKIGSRGYCRDCWNAERACSVCGSIPKECDCLEDATNAK